MKIIFDARVIEKQTHGIARFCVKLLDQLLTLDLQNEYLVLTRFPWVKDWFQSPGPGKLANGRHSPLYPSGTGADPLAAEKRPL